MGKREIYKHSDGKRVPSVTTILSRFKESGGLLHWANQCGLDGKTLEEARQPAASSGTMAHDLVEAHVNDWDMPTLRGPREVVNNAKAAYEQYLKWADQTKINIEHTEVSLVSEKHRFGGKCDAVGLVGNQLVLVDWKTSNSLYADYLLQCAAYVQLWNENYPQHEITGGVYICRFAKEHPDFAHHHFGDVTKEIQTFLRMRELYDMVKAVEKRVK